MQNMQKLGGLINILPFTYTMILIGSLSLMALPFLTGFYSKDLIIESAFTGTFVLSGKFGYWLTTFSACFTAVYSARLIYLTFLTFPNGNKYHYLKAHEPGIFMIIPFVVLAILSIFIGFFNKDLFIGLGA
jgi:NADH-ubiquinone oxidoreductase chain 5